jgi:hypothetical protein
VTSSVRRWAAGVGMAAATAMAGAMMALAIVPSASADDGDELLGQAGADLTQATQVLEQIPTTALDAREANGVAAGETFQTDLAQQAIPTLESLQANEVADQNNTLVLDADQQLVEASQQLLTADQGLLSAADAGDLNTLSGWLDARLPVSEGVLADYSAFWEVLFTDLSAPFDPSNLAAF